MAEIGKKQNMKVSQPNLFSCEASFSRSLKVCLSHQQESRRSAVLLRADG
jgi:hypothetical protein